MSIFWPKYSYLPDTRSLLLAFFNHTCMQVIHIHPYKSTHMSNESGNSFRPQSWSTLGSHTCGICGHTKQILCLSLFPVGRGVFWVIVQSLAGLAVWSCAIFFSIYFRQFFLSCGLSKTVVRQPFSRPCLECQTSLIPLRRTPEPGFRKFCWKHFPHVLSAVKSHNGTELILHHVKSLCGGSRLCLSELTLVILRVPLEFPGLAWSEASSSNMSLPHFVNFVPFFSFFWLPCGVMHLPLPHSLGFTSWSDLNLGSNTTDRQRSTWRDDFHYSAAVSNAHMRTDAYTCLYTLC